MSDRCPACGASLVSEPLKCLHCHWHLISLREWRSLPPDQQGYTLYMQGSWPTSPLRGVKNPYARDTPAWNKFREGAQRAVLEAQDGEE